MKTTIDKLPGLLQKKLPPVIWVSGDEPLQLLEASDLIRHRARATGIQEREVHEVDARFSWKLLLEATASLSLFGGSKLIEIRMSSSKPGKEGSEVIQQLCRQAAKTPDLLLFTSPRLDAAQQKSAWYKALDQAGLHLAVWPLDANQLPGWIHQRFQQAAIQADPAAVQLLAEKVEGNLLAASQEIEKLRLFVEPGQTLTADQLIHWIEDASRYSLFDLADACLAGKPDRAVKILYGLEGEGTEAPLLLWALTREIRQTAKLVHHLREGLPFDAVCKQLAIWQNRKALYRQASQRLKPRDTHQLLLLAEQADRAIKGSGDPLKDLLLELVIGFSKNRPGPG